MIVTLKQNLGYAMVSASWARRNFHQVLAECQGQPIGIQRYSRVLAVVWGMPFRGQAERELRLGQLEWYLPQLRALLFHYQLALRFLHGKAATSAARIDEAIQHMNYFRNSDYYSRKPADAWRTIIEMPYDQMAREMLRRDRWGFELRLASPFMVGGYEREFNARLEEELKDWSNFEREHRERKLKVMQDAELALKAKSQADTDRMMAEWEAWNKSGGRIT